MDLPLSPRVQRLLECIFESEEASAIARRLESEVAQNIPFHDKSTPSDMDRVRFSVIKLVGKDGCDLDSAIELAKTDWRDLFMAAGFGYSACEHDSWYAEVSGDEA